MHDPRIFSYQDFGIDFVIGRKLMSQSLRNSYLKQVKPRSISLRINQWHSLITATNLNKLSQTPPSKRQKKMASPGYYENEQPKPVIHEARAPKNRNLWSRITHSFRRRNDAGHELALGEAVREAGDLSRLSRKLKTRHLQMIAIGGSIGCGLFIASGAALKTGGPGAVILDFCIIGLMMFCTVNAMGELATLFPVQGYLFSTWGW
jgi:Amino acid permease